MAVKETGFKTEITLAEMLKHLEIEGCKAITRIREQDGLVIVEWE